MPSTYTQNLGIEQPATGEQAGVWGTTVNNNLGFLDTGIDGNLSIALSASAYSLITQPGAASQGRNKVIVWTGTLTAVATVTIQPNTAQKLYFMTNATNYPVIFQQGTGNTVTIQPGYSMAIYCDGAGSGAGVHAVNANPQFGNIYCGNVTVTGTLTVQTSTTFTQPVTFSAAVTLTGQYTTADYLIIAVPGWAAAPYDIYYRHSTGPLVPLPIGTAGQLLSVLAGGSIGWSTVTIALGQTVSGASPHAIFFASPSGTLAQDANLNISAGVGIGAGLVPTHTLHAGANLVPELWLDGNNPQTWPRELVFATNGSPRWVIGTPPQAESGGNAGSDLNIAAYNDAGSPIFNCLSIARASGNVTIGAFGDEGARLFVLGSNPAQPPLIVRGAASQSTYLQIWQNSAGARIASIDQNGVLYLAGASLLTLNSAGRLNLWGTTPGYPLGTIHIGQEPSTTYGVAGRRASLCFDVASDQSDALPPGVIRFYFHGGCLVIQYYFNGQQYFAYLNLNGAPPTWNLSNSVPI